MTMDISKDRILIIGLGKTGIETSRFLKARGADFKAADSQPLSRLGSEVGELLNSGVKIETGRQRDELFDWADVIIPSPGVSFNTPQIKKALQNGKKIISEIELASYFISRPVIGITGTNGKTTTTTLISKILENSGKKVFTGGNIGVPLISIAGNDGEYDYLVLELSSFQLQGIEKFKPFIGVILNISDNHLDHHIDFEEYLDAKLSLFKNHNMENWAVFNKNDKILTNRLSTINTNKLTFGKIENGSDLFSDSKKVFYKNSSVDISNIKLLGSHNIENIMAAAAVATILGIDNSTVEDTVREFQTLAHRLEFVKTVNGIKIYNDSKSTSPDATLKAIESLDSPIILVAGGKDKDIDYRILNNILKLKVKHLILIGEAKEKMKKQLQSSTFISTANSLEDAVKTAMKCSQPEDTLLFSPGCSSFDMFKSYEERGRKFKEIVENI